MDVFSIAKGGLAAAERRFETAASRVAQAATDERIDLSHEMVEMIQAKHHVSANLKVIRFADEMWKSLLEIQVR